MDITVSVAFLKELRGSILLYSNRSEIMNDLSTDCFGEMYENVCKKKRVHRCKKSSSILVLRPKHRKRPRSSPRQSRRISELSPVEDKLLHPVKLGRYKLKDRVKFTRMDEEGSASLGIVSVKMAKGTVPTLGQVIGMQAVKFKPKPLRVIKKKMRRWLEEVSETMSRDIPLGCLENSTLYDALIGMFGQQDASTQTDVQGVDEKHTVVNFNQLRSLNELGIDTEFLDYYERQSLLNTAGNLILQLNDEQYRRLSSGKKNHNSTETCLAKCLVNRLIPLAKSLAPGDLTSVETIHHILGIQV